MSSSSNTKWIVAVVIVIVLLVAYEYSQSTGTVAVPAGTTSAGVPVVASVPASGADAAAAAAASAPAAPAQAAVAAGSGGSLFGSGGTTYSDTALELYPSPNYGGWDSNNFNSSLNMSFQDAAIPVGDTTKRVNFMSIVNGQYNWMFQSLKAAAGTILEVTGQEPGGGTPMAFIVVGSNIDNLPAFMQSQQNFWDGNAGGMDMAHTWWNTSYYIGVISPTMLPGEMATRNANYRAMGEGTPSWNGIVGNTALIPGGVQIPSSNPTAAVAKTTGSQ